MVNKIKILVGRIKMIIQPAKVNLSIKNRPKHYSNDWILQEFFCNLNNQVYLALLLVIHIFALKLNLLTTSIF